MRISCILGREGNNVEEEVIYTSMDLTDRLDLNHPHGYLTLPDESNLPSSIHPSSSISLSSRIRDAHPLIIFKTQGFGQVRFSKKKIGSLCKEYRFSLMEGREREREEEEDLSGFLVPKTRVVAWFDELNTSHSPLSAPLPDNTQPYFAIYDNPT
jgi:hypothetical protein